MDEEGSEDDDKMAKNVIEEVFDELGIKLNQEVYIVYKIHIF